MELTTRQEDGETIFFLGEHRIGMTWGKAGSWYWRRHSFEAWDAEFGAAGTEPEAHSHLICNIISTGQRFTLPALEQYSLWRILLILSLTEFVTGVSLIAAYLYMVG
jgi:hypothetical protein